MKKRVIARTVLGLPIGIAIGNIITLAISLIYGGGNYIVCTEDFIALVGNEAAAAAVQTLLCGVMGMGYAAASLIWESEMSLLKQTVICFFIYAALLFPVAFFAGWMERSLAGVLGYIGIFAGIFAGIWLTQFFMWKNKVRTINKMLKK